MDPELDRIALKTFAQWRYRPGLLDGKPIRVFVQATVTFSYR